MKYCLMCKFKRKGSKWHIVTRTNNLDYIEKWLSNATNSNYYYKITNGNGTKIIKEV